MIRDVVGGKQKATQFHLGAQKRPKGNVQPELEQSEAGFSPHKIQKLRS